MTLPLGVFTMEDDGTGTMVPVLLAAKMISVVYNQKLLVSFLLEIFIFISGYNTSEGDYTLAVNNLI